ncbi:MAG TPA: ion channel [Nocardioidaceae bacterium]|nr:ion channel [Nocardioidaceae bacterium]
MGRLQLSRRWLKPGLLVAGVALVLGAGAGAAFETESVGSYWRGLWWAVSLMTTVGFIGQPPQSAGGAVVSVVLMVIGFLLLSLLSAALASLFVRQDEEPFERRENALDDEVLRTLALIMERLDDLDKRERPAEDEDRPT